MPVDKCIKRAVLMMMLLAAPSTTSAQSRPSDSDSLAYFFSSERVLSFAGFLFDRKDYRRAATEYERYLFGADGDRSEFARFRLGLCLLRMQAFRESANGFESLVLAMPTPDDFSGSYPMADTAAMAWAGALLLNTIPDSDSGNRELMEAIEVIRHRTNSPVVLSRLSRFEVLSHLRSSRWSQADIILSEPTIEEPARGELSNLVEVGRNLPHKSPAVGMLLSALIPGSGKVYAGQPTDGLVSAVLIGGQAWLSYQGFRKRGIRSFKGWLFGAVGLSFYAGNVYGSKVAVKLYNQEYADGLADEITTHIGVAAAF